MAEMLQQGWHPHAGMSPGQTSTDMLSSGIAGHCFIGRWVFKHAINLTCDRRMKAMPRSTVAMHLRTQLMLNVPGPLKAVAICSGEWGCLLCRASLWWSSGMVSAAGGR